MRQAHDLFGIGLPECDVRRFQERARSTGVQVRRTRVDDEIVTSGPSLQGFSGVVRQFGVAPDHKLWHTTTSYPHWSLTNARPNYLPPVVAMPWINVFCAKKNRMIIGRVKMVDAAISCA